MYSGRQTTTTCEKATGASRQRSNSRRERAKRESGGPGVDIEAYGYV